MVWPIMREVILGGSNNAVNRRGGSAILNSRRTSALRPVRKRSEVQGPRSKLRSARSDLLLRWPLLSGAARGRTLPMLFHPLLTTRLHLVQLLLLLRVEQAANLRVGVLPDLGHLGVTIRLR